MSLLDLTAGQRSEKIRWQLLDDALEADGADLSIAGTPRIEATTDSPIMRRLSGVTITPKLEPRVDEAEHLLRPKLVLADGSERGLGAYRFEQVTRARSTAGATLTASLVDETVRLDQPSAVPYSIPAGATLDDAILATAAEAGFPAERVAIDSTGRTAGQPLAWPVGHNRLQRMRDLANAAGYHPPHVTLDDKLRLRPVTVVVEGAYDHRLTLDKDSRVKAGSISETNDRLRVPNTWVVVSTEVGGTIVGRYTLPAAHPLSAANVGERVRKIDVQGLESEAAADAAAYAIAAREQVVTAWVEITTPLDPRMEPYQIVELDGVQYREIGASMEVRTGGAHVHRLVRVYPDG